MNISFVCLFISINIDKYKPFQISMNFDNEFYIENIFSLFIKL